MKDDFLAQIQAAEKQAEELIEGAKKRLLVELSEFKKELEKAREKSISKERVIQQEKLAEKNIEGREKYNELASEGEKEVQIIKKESENKQEKMTPSLEVYFLNDLLS